MLGCRWLRGSERAFQNRQLAPVSHGVHSTVAAGLDANLKGALGAPPPTQAVPRLRLSGPGNDCRGATWSAVGRGTPRLRQASEKATASSGAGRGCAWRQLAPMPVQRLPHVGQAPRAIAPNSLEKQRLDAMRLPAFGCQSSAVSRCGLPPSPTPNGSSRDGVARRQPAGRPCPGESGADR